MCASLITNNDKLEASRTFLQSLRGDVFPSCVHVLKPIEKYSPKEACTSRKR